MTVCMYRDIHTRQPYIINKFSYTLIKKTRNILVRRRNIAVRRRNNCCGGKALIITYSEYVSVALVIQQTKCMVHIIQPSVACLDLQDFFSLPQKTVRFLETVTEHKMCFDFLCNFCPKHSSLQDQSREINVLSSSRKVPFILVIFQ